MLEKFAFVIHPLSAKKDIARKYPFVKILPESWVEWGLRHKSPMEVSHITGVQSARGRGGGGMVRRLSADPQADHEPAGRRGLREDHRRHPASPRTTARRSSGWARYTSVVGDGGYHDREERRTSPSPPATATPSRPRIEGALKGAELMGIEPDRGAGRGGRRDRLHRQDLRAASGQEVQRGHAGRPSHGAPRRLALPSFRRTQRPR